jgi:cold shock CspA family protein
MDIPLDITLRGVSPYEEALKAEIAKRAEKLGRLYTNIMRCHVVVEAPHKHRHKGMHYNVRIELSLPQKKIVVNREKHLRRSHEDINAVVRDAFDAAKRKLEDFAGHQRGEVKAHETPPHGRVSQIFPDKGYGFIRTSDGREIYFHRNSVMGGEFGKLEEGSEVRFSEETGDKGPQASTVRAVGKHHIVQ